MTGSGLRPDLSPLGRSPCWQVKSSNPGSIHRASDCRKAGPCVGEFKGSNLLARPARRRRARRREARKVGILARPARGRRARRPDARYVRAAQLADRRELHRRPRAPRGLLLQILVDVRVAHEVGSTGRRASRGRTVPRPKRRGPPASRQSESSGAVAWPRRPSSRWALLRTAPSARGPQHRPLEEAALT